MCVHTRQDLHAFALLAMNIFLPFFAGMITGGHIKPLAVWFMLAIIFFGYVEAHIL